MTIRDIFVPLFQHVDGAPQLDAAARLASSLNAQINVVFTRPDAIIAAAAVPDMLVAAGVVVDAIEQEGKLAEGSAMTQFKQWRIANGLVGATKTEASSHVGATWHERVGRVTKTITDVGRVSDLIVIGRPDPSEAATEEMFTAAIYSTGQPTMIVPDRTTSDPLDHVVIAWNGSLEAARAVDGAMPMLRIAKRVSIFTVPENPEKLTHQLGLIEHLSHHDIHAEYLPLGSSSGDIGKLLLESASNAGATMIVMGAYTHHRVREAFLGGVTHHVLKSAEIPVVMMH
jgi:nucleotide-binding universal stress UspA family protein